MSLVGGYPSQSFHPAAMPHEFYPYPGHHPQQTTAHRSYPEHHPAFVNGDEAYFQSWMMAANSQHPMTSNHPVDSYGIMSSEYGPMLTMNGAVPGRMKVRVVKRRVTANKKERRRTHSINSAFSGLRDCIPNVPSDTKLSKIKTLRLATSYIAYLMHVLDLDDGNVVDPTGFKAELNKKVESREDKRKREAEEILKTQTHAEVPPAPSDSTGATKRSKGRTGWPQHVWASELKQEKLDTF